LPLGAYTPVLLHMNACSYLKSNNFYDKNISSEQKFMHMAAANMYGATVHGANLVWTRGFLTPSLRHRQIVLEQLDGHEQTLPLLLELHQFVGLFPQSLDHIFVILPKLLQLFATSPRPRPVPSRNCRLFVGFR